MATRPQGVPDDAVVIPPGQTQTETLESVKKQVVKQNSNTIINYAIALQNWAINATLYQDLNMPVPPIPKVPPREVLHTMYANQGGVPQSNAAGSTEEFYLWMWQTSDGNWFPEPKKGQ